MKDYAEIHLRAKRLEGPIMNAQIESLESRRLMSWSTVEDIRDARYDAMTADASGNLYAAGRARDDAGVVHGIMREKAAGSSSWTTTWDVVPSLVSGITDIEVNAAGDVYLAGTAGSNWAIARRAAGSADFTIVDQFAGSPQDMTIDAAGNVFAVGWVAVAATTKNKPASSYWTVRKQMGGAGAFVTVDSFRYSGTNSGANGVTNIAEGSAAGIYVVGYGGAETTDPGLRHLVRKSTNGGVTWSTVDDFTYQSGQGSAAFAVSGDGKGNVYVAGHAYTSTGKGFKGTIVRTLFVVRKSATGNTGSWLLDDVCDVGQGGGCVPNAIGADLDGKMYVVGDRSDFTDNSPSQITRTNASGTWQTVDQLASGSQGFDFAKDLSGNLYTAGYASDAGVLHAIVRSSPAVNSPTTATFSSQPASSRDDWSLFSSQPISSSGVWSLLSSPDRQIDELLA